MKSDRKKEWARVREQKGKRVYGEQPRRRRNRATIFTPWAMTLKRARKRREERRKHGIEVKT